MSVLTRDRKPPEAAHLYPEHRTVDSAKKLLLMDTLPDKMEIAPPNACPNSPSDKTVDCTDSMPVKILPLDAPIPMREPADLLLLPFEERNE